MEKLYIDYIRNLMPMSKKRKINTDTTYCNSKRQKINDEKTNKDYHNVQLNSNIKSKQYFYDLFVNMIDELENISFNSNNTYSYLVMRMYNLMNIYERNCTNMYELIYMKNFDEKVKKLETYIKYMSLNEIECDCAKCKNKSPEIILANKRKHNDFMITLNAVRIKFIIAFGNSDIELELEHSSNSNS